jgi:hypothetical protein
MPALHFDSETHIYTLGGAVIPSVTQILKAEGFIGSAWYSSGAAARGTAVHAAIHYLTEGDLDESSVPPAIAGYLEAWKAFTAAGVFKAIMAETPLASTGYRFAGTVDVIGTGFGGDALIDIKTGPWQSWHDLQLAAYATLAAEHGHCAPGAETRILQLSADGKFKLHAPKTPRRDAFKVFVAARQTYQWKKENGYYAADNA